MATVLDTSVALAALRHRDPRHDTVMAWLDTVDDDLVTSPLAVAEIDFFAQQLGPRYEAAFWGDLESGAYAVRWWADAMTETIAVARRFPPIGLTDASLVALAARLRTNRIATLDHRHFRALTTTAGEPFVVLPADAP